MSKNFLYCMIIILIVMFPFSIIFHIIKCLITAYLHPALKSRVFEDQPKSYLPPNFS